MIVNYKSFNALVLIFSKDMTKVLLENKNNKYDGFFYKNETELQYTEVSKAIKEETGYEINPGDFRNVTNLQNINKIYQTTVLMTIVDLKDIVKENHVVIDVNNIPANCIPQLKWLIPLSIDLTVYGCEFNQILMK